MLRDGVGLDLDDLSSGNLVTGTVADGLLVLLDGGAVHYRSGSDTNVVVLGEHPSVEVGGDVVADVHLSHLLVERELLVRDLNPLLEGNGEVVLSGVHGLGDAGVGAVGTNDEVDLHLLGGSGAGSRDEFGVLDVVLGILVLNVVGGDVDGGDKRIDGLSSVGDGAVPEELVHDLTTAHANVLIGLEGVSDIDLNVGRRDKFHATDLEK